MTWLWHGYGMVMAWLWHGYGYSYGMVWYGIVIILLCYFMSSNCHIQYYSSFHVVSTVLNRSDKHTGATCTYLVV